MMAIWLGSVQIAVPYKNDNLNGLFYCCFVFSDIFSDINKHYSVGGAIADNTECNFLSF